MGEHMTEFNKKMQEEAVCFLATGIQSQAELLAQEYLSNSAFNAAVTGDNWYVNYNKTGVVARVIYGENTFYQPDQDAIMWVIVNRMITTYYEGNTILEKAYSIVSMSNQFDGLKNNNAMKSQNVSDSGWCRAVYLACVLEIATSLDDIKIAVPRPAGIQNHTLFYSATGLGEIIDDDNQTGDRIENLAGSSQLFGVDANNDIMIKIYKQDGGYYWNKVTNVASAGIGSVSGPLSAANLNVIRRKFLDRSVQNAFIEI